MIPKKNDLRLLEKLRNGCFLEAELRNLSEVLMAFIVVLFLTITPLL